MHQALSSEEKKLYCHTGIFKFICLWNIKEDACLYGNSMEELDHDILLVHIWVNFRAIPHVHFNHKREL